MAETRRGHPHVNGLINGYPEKPAAMRAVVVPTLHRARRTAKCNLPGNLRSG